MPTLGGNQILGVDTSTFTSQDLNTTKSADSINGVRVANFTRDFLFDRQADLQFRPSENRLRAVAVNSRTQPARRAQLIEFADRQVKAATERSATSEVLLERSRQRLNERQNLRSLTLGL